MISIYTHSHNPLTKEFWKWLIKKILRKYSGPDAVLDSLVRGLIQKNIPFEINPLKPKYNVLHVVSGIEILQRVLKHKKEGQCVIAGPAITTTPLEKGRILTSNSIDAVLVPSKWVKEFYIALSPDLSMRTHVWPAGVQMPTTKTNKTGPIIIYKKDIADHVYKKIIRTLQHRKFQFKVLTYGDFSHKEYIENLHTAPFLIYLQTSESQGIALQEAWSYDVPTLVYKNTSWSYLDYTWHDAAISAPYLADDTGFFFTLEDFLEKLMRIESSIMYPKEYCAKNLSDQRSVEILFDIIKKI